MDQRDQNQPPSFADLVMAGKLAQQRDAQAAADKAAVDQFNAQNPVAPAAPSPAAPEQNSGLLGDMGTLAKQASYGALRSGLGLYDALTNTSDNQYTPARMAMRGGERIVGELGKTLSEEHNQYQAEKEKDSFFGLGTMLRHPIRAAGELAAENAPAIAISTLAGGPATFGALAAGDTYANNVDKQGREAAIEGGLVSGITNAAATKGMEALGGTPLVPKAGMTEVPLPQIAASNIGGIAAMGAGTQAGENVAQGNNVLEGTGKAALQGAAAGGFFGAVHAAGKLPGLARMQKNAAEVEAQRIAPERQEAPQFWADVGAGLQADKAAHEEARKATVEDPVQVVESEPATAQEKAEPTIEAVPAEPAAERVTVTEPNEIKPATEEAVKAPEEASPFEPESASKSAEVPSMESIMESAKKEVRDNGENAEQAIEARKLSESEQANVPAEKTKAREVYDKLDDNGKALVDHGIVRLHEDDASFAKAWNEIYKDGDQRIATEDQLKNKSAYYDPNDQSIHIKAFNGAERGLEHYRHEINHAVKDVLKDKYSADYQRVEDHLTREIKPVIDAVNGLAFNKREAGLAKANEMLSAGKISPETHKVVSHILKSESYDPKILAEEFASRKMEKYNLDGVEPANLTPREKQERSILSRIWEAIKRMFAGGERRRQITDAQVKSIMKGLVAKLVEQKINEKAGSRIGPVKGIEESGSTIKSVGKAVESGSAEREQRQIEASKPRALSEEIQESKTSPGAAKVNSKAAPYDGVAQVLNKAKDSIYGWTGGDVNRNTVAAKLMPPVYMKNKYPVINRSFIEIQRQLSFWQNMISGFSKDYNLLFPSALDSRHNLAEALVRSKSLASAVKMFGGDVNKFAESVSGKAKNKSYAKVLTSGDRRTLSALVNRIDKDNKNVSMDTIEQARAYIRDRNKENPRDTTAQVSEKTFDAYKQYREASKRILENNLVGEYARVANRLSDIDFTDFRKPDGHFDLNKAKAAVHVALDEHFEAKSKKINEDRMKKLESLEAELKDARDRNSKNEIDKITNAMAAVEARSNESVKNLAEHIKETKSVLKEFEDNTELGIKNGYAPMLRIGDFAVYHRAKTTDGNTFYARQEFESARDAHKFMRELREEDRLTPAELKKLGLSETANGLVRKGESDFNPKYFSMKAFDQLMERSDMEELLAPYQQVKLHTEALKMALSGEQARLHKEISRKGVEGWEKDPIRVMAKWANQSSHDLANSVFEERVNKLIKDIDRGGENGDLKTYMNELYAHAQGSNSKGEDILSVGAKNLKGFMSVWMLSSPASAIYNLTSNVINTPPLVHSIIGDAGKTTRIMGDAFKLATKSFKADGTIDYAKLPDSVAHAVKIAEQEGRLNPAELMAMMNAAENGNLGAQAFGKALMTLFGHTENFNRLTAAIVAGLTLSEARKDVASLAKYYESKGMKFDPVGNRSEADFINHIIDSTQMLMNSGNTAPAARSAAGSLLYTFKSYSLGTIALMQALPPKSRLLMMGLLGAMAGTANMPFEDDILDVIETVAGWMGHPVMIKAQARKAFEDMVGERVAELVSHGLLNAVTGTSGDARIGLSNIVPGTRAFDVNDKDALNKAALEIAGPTMGLAKNLSKAIGAASDGNFFAALRAFSPAVMSGVSQATQAVKNGYFVDSQGRKAAEATPYGIILKALGFQPEEYGLIGRARNDIAQQEQIVRSVQERFAGAMARATKAGDFEERSRLAQDAMKYQEMMPPELRMNMASMFKATTAKIKELNQSVETQVAQHVGKQRRAFAMQEIKEAEGKN